MKLKVIFKNDTSIEIDNEEDFAIVGSTECVMRVNITDGRTHFINFHEVLACLEVKEETE